MNHNNRTLILCILSSVLLALLLVSVIWIYIHNNVILHVQKTFADGSTYIGEWLSGTMNGNGKYVATDGEIYEGEFLNGRRDGVGKASYIDGSTYDGYWKDDLYHGEGKYISPKGNLYEGVWKFGQLPEGRLKTKDLIYEGGFDELAPDGAGVSMYRDGKIYAGYWSQGYKQGLGRLTYADGRVDFGFWDQGVLMHTGKKRFITGDVVYGIDVSRHQGTWNWEDLALYANAKGEVYTSFHQMGYEVQPSLFIIMKATEGATIQDPLYKTNLKQAKEGGIVKGAYHFMTTQSIIEDQISNFISNAVVEKGDFPPVLDIEIPTHRMKEVGVSKVQSMALQWLREIQKHYGVRPIIYTNEKFRRDYLNVPEFANYDYWMARYSDREPESGDWLIWQFTQVGQMRGISSSVDVNCFHGSLTDMKAYLTKCWK